LARIAEQTREVLGVAAVLGRSFTFRLLEAASGIDPDSLIAILDEAENGGFLISSIEYPEARFQFAHELIRQSVLGGLSAPRRQRLHGRVADAIERVYAPNPEDRAEDLAHHFWSAGTAVDAVKTMGYLQMAGDKAARASANIEAVNHFRRALEIVNNVPETPARLQQELSIQTSLGTALIATKGFSSGEVEKVYARARELSQRVGETSHLFRVLFGMWLSQASRGEYGAALELAQQCLRLADSTGEAGLRLQGHHALGVAFLCVGNLTQALRHLEDAISIYDPEQHGSYAHTYGHDPAVVCLMHAGWALWLLGFPDQAMKRGNESLLLAQKLAEPSTSATAAAFVACIEQMCGNVKAVEELSKKAIAISTEHQFEYYKAMANILEGWAKVELGQQIEGIARMTAGLDDFRSVGGVLLSSYFAGLLVEASMKSGAVDGGGSPSDMMNIDLDPWWAAELHRLKGELTLQQSDKESSHSAKEASATECFVQSLAVARAQKAKSLELRAATSLCRLWVRQDKSDEARELLGEVLSSFSEGFATSDLKSAKILFEEL
jgi:predicted ATPase